MATRASEMVRAALEPSSDNRMNARSLVLCSTASAVSDKETKATPVTVSNVLRMFIMASVVEDE